MGRSSVRLFPHLSVGPGQNMSEITWPKLIIGALLTAGLTVGGNQLAENTRADGEIRQETRKKQKKRFFD